jgi:hypothetical protein
MIGEEGRKVGKQCTTAGVAQRTKMSVGIGANQGHVVNWTNSLAPFRVAHRIILLLSKK